MKAVKLSLTLVAAALMILGLGSTSYAFHSGGVAECEGCHTMHNSLGNVAHTSAHNANGSTVSLAQFTAGPYLLQGSDQSSACLNCHQHQGDTGPSSYHISTASADMPTGTAPLQLTPGGDFGWLKKTYSWVPRTGSPTETSAGERHGHNINAQDYGYIADTTLTTAPGGTYSASQLHCSSCHDPHGRYRRNDDGSITLTGKPIRGSGSYNNSANPDANFAVGVYRILGGTGYAPKSYTAVTFTNNPPAAVAPSSYNRSEGITQTRVAYGSGMSEWCANCHSGIHNDSYPTNMRHPAGNGGDLGATIAGNYNAYVKSGDLTGTSATSYNSLVPFEEGIGLSHSVADYTSLKTRALITDAQLGGPTATSNVSCLSCHRAHASGWDSMVRYELGYEFMMVANTNTGAVMYPGTDNPYSTNAASQGRTVAEHKKSYYDRPETKFAAYQRVYCNKCHAKD